MFFISPALDNYFLLRLKNKNFREQCYRKALKKELRQSKLGTILLRNLNEVMAANHHYHEEFSAILQGKDYQQAFWESDLGYLWYQGNLQQQNKYFELAIHEVKENAYQTHLDVGCGWGELSNRAAECNSMKKALGIDISEDIIKKAKELNKGTKAIYEFIDILDVNENFDFITLFGSTDYIPPNIFSAALEKIISLANKQIIIVNSLRKINFDESLSLQHSIEVTRYDTGYVHPINYYLQKSDHRNTYSFEIKKFGLDSSLTIIKKK